MERIDLDAMERDELITLQKKVDKALKDYDTRKRAEAIAAARDAAKEHGYALDDLLQGGSGAGGKAKGVPKYANPENPSDTWTGRGRKPKWLEERLAAGDDQEEFLIKA